MSRTKIVDSSWSAQANKLFGQKVLDYAELFKTQLTSNEISGLCDAIRIAWDVLHLGNQLPPDQVFGVAMMANLWLGSTNPDTHMTAVVLRVLYQRQFLFWRFPLRSLEENLRAMKYCSAQKFFTDLASSISRSSQAGGEWGA